MANKQKSQLQIGQQLDGSLQNSQTPNWLQIK
jgi:hypothetical protein